MTVAATLTSVQYTGNGSATQYSFNNKIFQASDLIVTLFDLSGNQYSFPNQANTALGLSYTVQNVDVDTGCLVVFSGPPTLNWTIDLRTQVAQTQSTSIKNQGAFLPELHEEAFDRVTRALQDVVRQAVTYSIRAADNETIPWPPMPAPANRGGTLMMFDPITKLPTTGVPNTQVITIGLLAPFLNLQQTQAESSAGVTPSNLGYVPFDIRRYGGDPTGVSPSDAALASAILVCGATGGTILAPAGLYTFANPIALNVKTSIIIQGDGDSTGGAQPATRFAYSGTTSPWIDMRSSVGCALRGIQLVHTNASFTGTYIKCGNDGTHGDPTFCYLQDCTLGTSVNAVGNVHLDLDKCTLFTATNCSFQYGNPSVKGQASSSYSNVIRFRDCLWFNNYAVPINSQGQSWTFEGCTFENLTTGAAGAIAGAVAGVNPTNGLVVSGCWFGDVQNTAPAGSWIDGCIGGALITGNYISGNGTSNNTTAITLRQASGVAITGNLFDHVFVVINFATGNCFGVSVKGNGLNALGGGGSVYLNTANIPLGQLDFSLGFGFTAPSGHGLISQNGYSVRPDGRIEQWGFVNPATFGTHAITPFPVAFPTGCLNVTLTLSGVAATTATIYASSLTTTGFTYTLTDGTSTTDSFFWRAIGN